MAKDKAKKNTGKGKKDAKKKDSGSKLPKSLKTGAFKDLLSSDLGREILADALIAAAGAAAAALTRTRTARKAGAAAADARTQTADYTKDAMNTAAGAVAGVVTEAARHFLPASLVGEDEKDQGTSSKAPAKKPASRKAPPKAAKAANKDGK